MDSVYQVTGVNSLNEISKESVHIGLFYLTCGGRIVLMIDEAGSSLLILSMERNTVSSAV